MVTIRRIADQRRCVRRGFTLIEIMIVIAIIATLAALAMSSMLRSRMNANEVAAIAALRTVSSAAQSYYAQAVPHTYPPTLAALGAPTSDPPYLDDLVAGGSKEGYAFTYVLVDTETYACRAAPQFPGKTGNRYFYVDEKGKMTAGGSDAVGPNDPPVE